MIFMPGRPRMWKSDIGVCGGETSERSQTSAEKAELVALRIGEDVPGLVAGLSDVGLPSTQGQESFQLRVLVAVGGVDVEVQARFRALRRPTPTRSALRWPWQRRSRAQ